MFDVRPPFFLPSELPHNFSCVVYLTNGIRIFRRPDLKYELYFEKSHLYLRFGVTNSITQALHFSYNA